ncbi:MAG: DNA translocase FtsK [Thermoguttaceae bacterium]|nr:DNA translocase FtsK [Thermoguttaceae bacterium]
MEDRGKVAFGALFTLLWLFLCVSVLSYSPWDLPTKFAYQETERIGNVAGLLGAWCAGVCSCCFGAASYFLVLELGIAALFYWLDEIKELTLKTIGGFVMLAAASGFSAYAFESSSGSPIGPGGCVGAMIKFFFDGALKPSGAYIALFGLFFSGLLLVLPDGALRFLFWSTGLARAVVRIVAPYQRRINEARPIAKNRVNSASESDRAPELERNTSREERRYARPGVAPNYGSPRPVYKTESVRPYGNSAASVSVGSAERRRDVEVNPADFGKGVVYDKEKEPLLRETFGPKVKEARHFEVTSDEAPLPLDPREFAEGEVAERSGFSDGANEFDDARYNSLNNPPYERVDDYEYPPLDLLEPADEFDDAQFQAEILERGEELERVCLSYGVEVKVVAVRTGPVLTMYEVELKAGLRIKNLLALEKDLEIGLRAERVRIVSPLPNKKAVGIELPNRSRRTVRLRETLEACADQIDDMEIPIFLGKDVVGSPMIADLSELPHLLVAGRTGTGKSVCLNSIIMSILMTRGPKRCKLILIDPKMVEFYPYRTIPHLMHPVVVEMDKAAAILEWATEKMESRYRLFAKVGARKLSEFNSMPLDLMRKRLNPKSEAEWLEFPKSMPSIVIVADEMADLIMTAGKEVENHITRLAQKSRAVGIHLVLATQKPTVDVITGLIKSNLPARVSFGVATQSDSRVVLDCNGAEQLLGKGDMLFLLPGTSQTIRGQCAYVSDREIDSVIEYVGVEEPTYEIVIDPDPTPEEASFDKPEFDEYYVDAVEFVIGEGRASTSLLQRKFSIGYGRASRIIDTMAADGIITPFNPAKPSLARQILITMDQWRGKQSASETPSVRSSASNDSREDYADVYGPGSGRPNAAVPFAAPPVPGSDGDSAAVASWERPKSVITTPESVGLSSRANDSASDDAESEFEEYDLSPSPARDERNWDEFDESEAEEDEVEFAETDALEEYDEEEVDETTVGSSVNSNGWDDEKWNKYLDFDVEGDDLGNA